MSERREDLIRERRLLTERLADIDRELEGLRSAPLPPPTLPATSRADPRAEEEALLAQYQPEPGKIQTRTQLGCALYVLLALALLALGAGALYLHTRAAQGR